MGRKGGIIDLIALLVSIGNDASQTSSIVDDREEVDLATVQLQAAHKGKCNCSSCGQLWLVGLFTGLVGGSGQRFGWWVCPEGAAIIRHKLITNGWFMTLRCESYFLT